MDKERALELAIEILEEQSCNPYMHGHEKMMEIRKAVIVLTLELEEDNCRKSA